MEAKEKAEELFNKFCYAIGTDRTDSGYFTNVIYAKQCALIAVEEILHCESTEPSNTDWDDCGATAQYYWTQKKVDAGKFWGDVKKEIEKI